MKKDSSMVFSNSSSVLEQNLVKIHSEIKDQVFENEEKLGYECLGSGIVEKEIEIIVSIPRGNELPEELVRLFDLKFDFVYNVEVHKWKSIDELTQLTYKLKVRFIS